MSMSANDDTTAMSASHDSECRADFPVEAQQSSPHDPLCVLADPCEPDCPEHGYCTRQDGLFCIHCMQWCICERLSKADARARADERERIADRLLVYAEEWPEGDFAQTPRFVLTMAARAVRGLS